MRKSHAFIHRNKLCVFVKGLMCSLEFRGTFCNIKIKENIDITRKHSKLISKSLAASVFLVPKALVPDQLQFQETVEVRVGKNNAYGY